MQRATRSSSVKISPRQVLAAYQQGFFPMAQGQFGRIEWYIAEPRTVVPLNEEFQVRRSLAKAIHRSNHEVRVDSDFEQVIRACARHGEVDSSEVWLSEEMIELYLALHDSGDAHSVEVWTSGDLTGGLYGIAMRGAFFGESMFSRAPYASQFALVALVERLRERDYVLLDAQVRTAHIAQFGAIDLTHGEYLSRLAVALGSDCSFV
jgi:leucyl/phenylalanyl-tRNA--protein transferase